MQRVLILGAGINGAALARDLIVCGVPVCVVDTADLASGTTAYSSRLIHGGLRYMEYGEFGLVRESLAERTRLLRLAPQFVKPLELFIPIRHRFSGFRSAIGRIFGRDPQPLGDASGRVVGRGLWLVRLGLWLYDQYAKDSTLPRHRMVAADEGDGCFQDAPPVDASRYRWQCSYWDAAIQFPERFVLALLEDARQEAARQGIEFRLLNYHRASLCGKMAEVFPLHADCEDAEPIECFEPAAIVNATGAWVDHTLQQLQAPSRQLLGGAKGSHLVTLHKGLHRALAGRGIYVEADDGRPVFLLPLGEGALVGTTDIPYSGDPAAVVATQDELDYLLDSASQVFANVHLSRADVAGHYSGVRPLPCTGAATPGSVTRRHWLEENTASEIPLYSVIGGKLTTCRSLAEDAANVILKRLGLRRRTSTRDRIIPGGKNYPRTEGALAVEIKRLAERFSLTVEAVEAIWKLYGTRSEFVLNSCGDVSERLNGTLFPVGLARWMIRNEWAGQLEDLVCRRLMLLFDPRLSLATMRHLANLLVECGQLRENEVEATVSSLLSKFETRYGRQVKR